MSEKAGEKMGQETSAGYSSLLNKLKAKLSEDLEGFEDSLPTEILEVAHTSAVSQEKLLSGLKFLGDEYSKEMGEWLWTQLQSDAKTDTAATTLKSAAVVKTKSKDDIGGVGRMVIMACKDAKDSVQERGREKVGGKRQQSEEETKKEKRTEQPKPRPKGSIFERLKKPKDSREAHPKRPVEEATALEPVKISKEGQHVINLGQANNNIRKQRKLEMAKEQEQEDGNDVHEAQKPGEKKMRCWYWPACPKGDKCEYWHPTEMCRNFPNCKYGDHCLYIHPQIRCKFGAQCVRPNCAFSHPARVPMECYNPAAFMPYMAPRIRPKNLKLVVKPEAKQKAETKQELEPKPETEVKKTETEVKKEAQAAQQNLIEDDNIIKR